MSVRVAGDNKTDATSMAQIGPSALSRGCTSSATTALGSALSVPSGWSLDDWGLIRVLARRGAKEERT